MPTSRAQVEDTYEAVTGYLEERGMTDGLPVVPPTEDRVAAMVEASGLDGDFSLGDFPPVNAPTTVEKVAVNSVMAGCEPKYMPALIAAVQAFLDPGMNPHGIQTTTNPVGPMILFNGPIRHELGINYGAGCFAPGTKANATIGRALRLVMVNVGGAAPGEVDKAALGWPGKYTSCCIGENEEDSPWEPFHVEMGFRPEESTVTIIPVSGMWPITEGSPDREMMLHHVTMGMAVSGHSATPVMPEAYEQVLVMSPVIAKSVAELQPTKAGLKQHLFDHARVPLDFYPPYRWEETRERLGRKGIAVERNDTRVPICNRPDKFIILCAGGMGGLQSVGLSCMLGKTVTRKIG